MDSEEFQRAVLDFLQRLEERSITQQSILRGLEDRVVPGHSNTSALSVSEGRHSLALAPELAQTLPPDALPPSAADSPIAPTNNPATASASVEEEPSHEERFKWQERLKTLEADLAAATADKEALWDQLETVEERKESLMAECTLLQQQVHELKLALEEANASEPSMSASMLSRSPSMSATDTTPFSPLGDVRARGGSPVPRVPAALATGTQGEQTLFGFRLRYPHIDPSARGRTRRPGGTAKRQLKTPVGVVRAPQQPQAARTISLSSPINDFTNSSFTATVRRSPTPPLASQVDSPGNMPANHSNEFPAA